METMEAHVNRIAVCYPTESLSWQMARWSRGKTRCAVEPCFTRSLIDIRRTVRGADFVVVDATADYAQAIDAYSQAAAQVGPQRVAVYSEEMHEGLEQFVRPRGSWVLLGPLGSDEWEGLLAPHVAGNAAAGDGNYRRAA
jgi:hypothetical protein